MDSLVLEGKIIQKLDVQEGVSARGPWKKQDFVIESGGQFPKKICISCWQEKVDELNNYGPDDMVRVAINIESREFNGKWYTDVKAWKFESGAFATGKQEAGTTSDSTKKDNDDILGVSFSEEDGELPF